LSNFVKSLFRPLYFSSVFILVSGCYQMPDRNVEGSAGGSQIKARYTSMSAGTVSSILRENLELDIGVAEEAAVLSMLDSSLSTFGRGNFAAYVPWNDVPAANKTKRYTEIFSSACWHGMNKATVAGRYLPTINEAQLGPFGEADFRSLYLGFLGRLPGTSETRELTYLAQGVLRNAENTSDSSATKARRVRAALCTAVLASLEGTKGR
jgi:hypothetical protein